MKRLFALLLTLAMLLSSAAMAEFDYTGLWTLTGAEAAGITLDPAAIGLNVSMLLNEDGSCVLTMLDETQNGTWAATATGITTTDAEGVVDTYTLVNSSLVIEQEGVKIIFAREAEKAINYVGTWTLESMEIAGMAENLSEQGISGGVVLNEDGSCVLSFQDVTANGTWAATETGITTTETGGAVDTYTLVDGKLVSEMGIVKMTFARAAEKIDYVGVWALTGMKTPDMTVDSTELSMDVTLSIYEDGTWKMASVSEDETVEGTWEETEGTIILTSTLGESITFTLTDGALVVEQDGMTLIFTLVESETEPVVEPETEPEMDPLAEEEYAEPLAGLTMADFNGEWAFVDAEYMGLVLDAETLGMTIDLHIQDGKGHMELVNIDGTHAQDAVCAIEEIEELGTVMYFLYTDPATGEATEYGITLVLYSDGELVWYAADEADNDILYCFEKVANISE